MSGFDQLRQVVMEDDALREKLLECGTDEHLLAEVAAAARERGLVVDQAELTAAVNLNRRRWLERWTQQ
jgi:hypothetical protein